jgi:RNA polymerase sigma factor (sigma-70 family)
MAVKTVITIPAVSSTTTKDNSMIKVPPSGLVWYGVPTQTEFGTKCEHGWYIPAGDPWAYYCSICQLEHNIVPNTFTPTSEEVPEDLDVSYQIWDTDKSEYNFNLLYKSLIKYSRSNMPKYSFGFDSQTSQEIRMVGALAAMTAIKKFDIKKGPFISWSHTVMKSAMVDWIQDFFKHDTVKTSDSVAVNVPDMALSAETKAYYHQLLDKLTKEEMILFRLKAEGMTEQEIARKLGILTHDIVHYRWLKIEAKVKEWNDGEES